MRFELDEHGKIARVETILASRKLVGIQFGA